MSEDSAATVSTPALLEWRNSRSYPSNYGNGLQECGEPPSQPLLTFTIRQAFTWWLLCTVAVVVIAFGLREHDPYASYRVVVETEDAELAEDTAFRAASEGRKTSQVGMLLLAFFGAYCFLRKEGPRPKLDKVLAVPMLFGLAWCGMSVLWSDEPGLTVRRLIVLMCCVFGALGIARQLTARQLCLFGVMVTGTYMLAGVLIELALGTFRPLAFSGEYRFCGTTHPNRQGVVCVLACVGCICLLREMLKNFKSARGPRSQSSPNGNGRSKWGTWPGSGQSVPHPQETQNLTFDSSDSSSRVVWYLFLGVLLVTLVLLISTRSRTALVGFAASLIILYGVRPNVRIVLGVLVLAWIFVVLIFLAELGMLVGPSPQVLLMGRGDKDENATLTGRTFLWETLEDYIVQRPILGYGYGSFWSPQNIEIISRKLYWGIASGHSLYYDLLLNLGAIGATAYLGSMLIGLARCGWRYGLTGEAGAGVMVGMLGAGLVIGFSESELLDPTFVTFFTGTCLCQLAFYSPFSSPDSTSHESFKETFKELQGART